MGGTAGLGGASTMGGGGAGGGTLPPEIPQSASKEALLAFIMAGSYKTSPWISDVPEPREGTPGSQHGGKVRVWENPTLVTSLKAGRDGRTTSEYPDQWSMAVKELFDPDSGELVGVAAALKTAPGSAGNAWTYLCYGPGQRCLSSNVGTAEAPIYGNGADAPSGAMECRICHGNSIYTVPQ